MRRRLVLEFTKMHGAGNDFVVIDNRFFYFTDEDLAGLARRLCTRRYGVGADGLLALAPPGAPDTDFRMRYFNADGSLGAMCGNGARCLVRFASEAGIDGPEFRFDSDDGVYRARLVDEPLGHVRLFVPDARGFRPDVALEKAVSDQPVHGIWTGVPHAVCFVDDIAQAPIEAAPPIRHDPAFPEGANVDFVQVEAATPARIRARTYERGVEAETLACGTGAIAAALIARLTGRVDGTEVQVEMPGGTLRVGFREAEAGLTDVYLEGPTAVVFRGTVEVE